MSKKSKQNTWLKKENFVRIKEGYDFESAETIHYSMIQKMKEKSGRKYYCSKIDQLLGSFSEK
jgi:hypothetical protein